MTQSDILRVNFTIAAAAKLAIEKLRRDYDAQFLDPAAVLWIGWGIADTRPRLENVVIGFYPESMLPEIADGIQEVSGVKFVFFTTSQYHPRFAGKVLDHSAGRGFFLRNP